MIPVLKRILISGLCVFLMLPLGGCAAKPSRASAPLPEIPEKLESNPDGIPVLTVHKADSGKKERMDIESYIMGVVAGEMQNSWPIEALKAQAILARTFTMKFVSSKDSAYNGADISTDVHEAQAYNAQAINDNIREAVNQTRGVVMTAGGEFPHAWFHAHSGGMTELPTKALEYSDDPAYLSAVQSEESESAPEDVKAWRAQFTLDEVQRACAAAGTDTGPIESFEIGERGASGRAVNFIVNGQKVSAPSFRLHIGASELKSTLIESAKIKNGTIEFSGRGFGHGVGMSQWGARKMAEDGMQAEEIIQHYYKGIRFAELW